MSASDKKKLRKEQNAAVLSEKQRYAQAEAKKLKIQTISFIIVMCLVVCIALGYLGYKVISSLGISQKLTTAATVGNHKLNSVELNYYYVDAVNEMYYEAYSDYSIYLEQYFDAVGLDLTKPLSQQTHYLTGDTWANYFLDAALSNAKSDYALYDKAMAEGFKLTAEQEADVQAVIHQRIHEAEDNGYSNVNKFLQTVVYGPGSSIKTYEEYVRRDAIAAAYYTAYYESLDFGDADYRKYEADKFDKYSSFSYQYCYLSYNDFQTGGTKNEETGKYTYTDEQVAAAREALEAAAKELETVTSVEELTEKIDTIQVGDTGKLVVTPNKNMLYTSIANSDIQKWVSEKDRAAGDVTKIAVTVKGEDGTEVTNGYYIVIFEGRNDNKEPLANVRHLLVKFEGGTTDEETGQTVYSDTEMAAAKEEAEGYLKTWQEGAKTEESFIELVKKYSDDTSASTGGLFEDINPDSDYVEGFLNWAVDPARVKGDAAVVQTEFGYHVMYYVGDDEMTYRDYMIDQQLITEAMDTWYNSALENVTVTTKDLKHINLDMVIAGGLA